MTPGADSSAVPGYQIRAAKAGDSDVNFILDSFDSTLSFLASIGSSGQWGTKPFSQRPEMVQFIQSCVACSTDDSTDQNAYIVERKNGVPCGAVIVDSGFPDYLAENKEAMKSLTGLSNFLYLNVLVTHKGVHYESKGAGDALINHVKLEAKRRKCTTILVDCWNGNDGALIKYYGKHGFQKFLEFTKMGKHVEGVLWHGMLLRLDL